MSDEGLYRAKVDLGTSSADKLSAEEELTRSTDSVRLNNPKTAIAIRELSEGARALLDDAFNREGYNMGVLRVAPDDDYAAAQLKLLDAAVKENDNLKAKILAKKIVGLTS